MIKWQRIDRQDFAGIFDIAQAFERCMTQELTKRTGWSPKGQRYRTHVPFGKWRTQTFIAGLRCHGLTAPFMSTPQ